MDELQKLYDVLSRDGYYTKSFEEFQAQYEDPAYRDKVFGVITRDGLYTNSREEFDVKYSPLKKKRKCFRFCATAEFIGFIIRSRGRIYRLGFSIADESKP